jgi:hypothetical protein
LGWPIVSVGRLAQLQIEGGAVMSQKEQLAELLAARADIREKREAARQARAAYLAAVRHFDSICDEVEAGQGRLSFKRKDDEPKSEAG